METAKLSTYAKGDVFEEKVFDFLSREIEEGRYLFLPKYCTIDRKKRYYSRDREDYIVFDIAIEVTMTGQDRASLITLVECKNYEGTVPVGDIEEFGSKISQVTGFNVKGIFASMSAFQSGTLNIAKNKGFGVVRYFEREGFQWELARTLLTGVRNAGARTRAQIEHGLTHPGFQSTIYDVYARTPQGYTNVWDGIWQGLDLEGAFDDQSLNAIRQPRQSVKQRVAFLSRDKIEERANQILGELSYIRGSVDLEKLVSREQQAGEFTVSYLPESDSALGSISFSPPEIKIFTDDPHAHLARFTLAHELGHFYLGHQRYLTRERIRAQDISQSQSITIPKGDIERLEWQANTFASYLLMPREDFSTAFKLLIEHHEIRNRGHGALFLDTQRANVNNFHLVAGALSKYFSVSKAAIRFRLIALGLLVEV
jgi:Zn-dependent peptidase ImmA (M78 family)